VEEDGYGIIGEMRSESEHKQYKEWHTEPGLWEKLKPIAREMRSKPTEAEELLWQRIRKCQIKGARFRRQHNIERFIVDFYGAKAKLVIEVDGTIHQYQEKEDKIRQAYLESKKLKVLRFSNDFVLNNTDEAIEQIINCLP